MKFSHSIDINDPQNPSITPLTRQQLWLGLVLRAEAPKLFMPHLDQCTVFDPIENTVLRELHFGDLIIRDCVTYYILQQVHYAIAEQGDIAASSLIMRIEEAPSGALSVLFEYDNGHDEAPDAANAMYDDYRRSAYFAADTDTIEIIRELAAQGALNRPAHQ
ncbi:MAG: SRPBCC family protein [Burkholderiaceae bacterium]